jgi:Na+-translocating ferredoxin:NAD+ oxidoreductase RnfC subunit
MHLPAAQVAEEISACIACGECLAVCPALAEPIPIEALNRETVHGPTTLPVARFARACYQCGACVPVCPVGLHRDAMMMWLKVRLLARDTLPHTPELEIIRPPHTSAGPRLKPLRGGRRGD